MKTTVLVILFGIALGLLSCTPANAPSASSPRAFASPDDAATALIHSAADWDIPSMLAILGHDGEDLVASADRAGDKARAAVFVAKANEKHYIAIDPEDPSFATLMVGHEDWPLPIPIIQRDGKWYFDSKAGRDEIIRRRVGANELDAITICRGYAEAQQQYASQVHDDSGVHQYAQRLVSTPGKQDGLAWQNPDGTWGGPAGVVVARGIEQGFAERGEPFHGYYFRVLKAQGPSATLGQMDYVVGDAMIGGFALIAWPAQYRVTGVETFMVGWDGVVYQKDLGPETAAKAGLIERYEPDPTWTRTDDEW